MLIPWTNCMWSCVGSLGMFHFMRHSVKCLRLCPSFFRLSIPHPSLINANDCLPHSHTPQEHHTQSTLWRFPFLTKCDTTNFKYFLSCLKNHQVIWVNLNKAFVWVFNEWSTWFRLSTKQLLWLMPRLSDVYRSELMNASRASGPLTSKFKTKLLPAQRMCALS